MKKGRDCALEFTVGADGEGLLLRTYLRRLKLSSRLISHLKAVERGIEVNGESCTVRRILHPGDRVCLRYEDLEQGVSATPSPLPVEVLYEDRDIVAVNKPSQMPTHPSHGHHDDTLANALAYRYEGTPFVFRPINRLDRNTSGIVLVARNTRAASILSDELQGGGFEKTYIAVCDGEFSGVGRIIRALRRTKESIIVRETCGEDDEGASHAETGYRVLASAGGKSLVRLFPYTGRTHQLRVHLASIGHPITGDDLYGEQSDLIPRQALHAQRLSFTLIGGERITLDAPLPGDILDLCRACGLDAAEATR